MTSKVVGIAVASVGSARPSLADRCIVPQSARDQLQAVWDDAAAGLARIALAMGLHPDEAEDVLQDVYLVAWQKGPPGASRTELRRWLTKVTANRCCLQHRRHKRWRGVLRAVTRFWSASSDGEPQRTAVRVELRELVHRALDELDPQLRTCLVLRYFAELDSKEIGRVLGIPDSTVRSQLRKARRLLASKLKQAGVDDDEQDV